MITWAEQIGGHRDVEALIDELREALFVAGLVPADVDTADETLREILNAERA